MGQESATIKLGCSDNTALLQLIHPGKGTAYALSYHPQKYIEALTGGEKPNIIVMGHYHKSEYLFYRNVHLIQAGCLEAQTPFMRRQNIAAMVGFWIIEFKIHEQSVIRFKTEWFPCF